MYGHKAYRRVCVHGGKYKATYPKALQSKEIFNCTEFVFKSNANHAALLCHRWKHLGYRCDVAQCNAIRCVSYHNYYKIILLSLKQPQLMQNLYALHDLALLYHRFMQKVNNTARKYH